MGKQDARRTDLSHRTTLWPVVTAAFLVAVLLNPATSFGQGQARPQSPETTQDGNPGASRPVSPALLAADALHAPFTELLKRFVVNGIVDYKGLSKNTAGLDTYIAALSQAKPGTGPTAFAYWINAYNAFTLRLILEHYPKIESIKDISSSDRWDAKRWSADGKVLSLDAIEHKILRPMGDPRIHFAINCASFSCPDLRNEAYLPSRLDAQLTDATSVFLANPAKGASSSTKKGFFGGQDHNLYVSKIFDWFEDDFDRWSDGAVAFVKRHGPQKVSAYIESHRKDLDVEHLDYDWSLNGK
ncbi:MAG: hypothetical protein ACI9EF_002580 [Pseudohongiellaceae bacterium]|jgi:hypothetical protein